MDHAIDILYDYCCGRLTARQVHAQLLTIGYTVNLRDWIGNVTYITCTSTNTVHEVEV